MELDVSASEAGPQSKKRRFMPNLADLPKYCSLQDLEVFESATQWDTIGVFYDGQVKNYVTGLLCEWAQGLEPVRMNEGRWKRICVIIAEEDDVVFSYSQDLQGLRPRLNIVAAPTTADGTEDETWMELMANDAIVMTHRQFLDYLDNGVLSFSQLNLLIIDNPELALESTQPLAAIVSALGQIIQDDRPRIFGVVEPSGFNFEFTERHLKLEETLGARFFGTSQATRDEIVALREYPNELVVRFSPPSKVVDTALCKHLRTFDTKERVYRTEFRAAKALLREVGPFAADWVWRRSLKKMEEANTERVYDGEDDTSAEAAKKEAAIRQSVHHSVKNWTFTMPNLDAASRGFNVSPKVTKLVQILQCFQQAGDTFRGVVLVRRRITALAIVEILKTASEQIPFIRVEALTGPWSHENLPQLSLLEDFKNGIYNLLIATKIAEDGLDMPPCTCVIRYDISHSSVSYAQTRAMAKGKDCHLILMLDKNSDMGRQTIRGVARMPDEVKDWTQRVAINKSGAYPPATISQNTEGYYSDSDGEAHAQAEYIKDPTMSGRIYAEDAVSVIYRYLATLRKGSVEDVKMENVFYFTMRASSEHVCTVVFPPNGFIAHVEGPPSVSPGAAKRAACFEACKRLHELGLLSYRLFPRPREVMRRLRPVAVSIDQEVEQTKGDILPSLPPAPSSEGAEHDPTAPITTQAPTATQTAATGTRCYKRKFPEFWTNAVSVSHQRYYPTIVTVDRNHNAAKPYRPVLLITRAPLPPVEDFKLFFATQPSITYLRPALPTSFNGREVDLLYRYTLRVMRSLLNKPLACSKETIPFLIAPLSFGWNIELGKAEPAWPYPDATEFIPWDLMTYAADQHLVPLRTDTIEALEQDIKDAVVQDWWTEFTKRYDCMSVRRDLNPVTPLEGMRKQKFSNLVEYCKAKRKGFEGLVDYDQPLIEVSNLPSVVNRLSPTISSSNTAPGAPLYTAKFVIPELCSKFTIPASTMRTLSLLPSIMKRVEDTLLVRELNAMYFNNEIDESALQAAITAPSASMEVDYERLELLGDAYLKYLSSIYLFVTNPNKHEGILHLARQKIISNRALLVNADKSGLPQYIQSKPFLPKMWLPRGYTVVRPEPKSTATHKESRGNTNMEIKEERSSPDPNGLPTSANEDKSLTIKADEQKLKSKKSLYDEDHQWLGDKCVADVAEAIIGAAFQTGGPSLGLKVVKSLHLPLPFIESWDDFSLKAKAPPPDLTITLEDNVLETVEATVGAKFHRPHILAQALTHTSARGNDMTCYERLEFLGDAVLDFLVIQHIFDLHGRLTPGALTMLKGAMVSNSALAAISVHYGLHKFLVVESKNVKKAIDEYVPAVEEKQRLEYAAADEEGRLKGQYWLEVEPPKSVADVVESILGALYVSDGFKLTGAQAMYDTLLRPFYDQHISLKTLSHHPTKILFELFQSQGCQAFEITKHIDEHDGELIRCEVVVHNVILAAGVDQSQNFAARRASFEALDALEGDPDFMSRLCDCRSKAEQRKAAKRAAKALHGKGERPPVQDSDEDDMEM